MEEKKEKTRKYDTKVINLLGGPGAGKSLMAALVYAELKMRGKLVEFVQEYVKTLVWKEDFDKINNQMLICKEQYEMLKSVDGKVEYIITDGPLLHGLYYGHLNPNNVSNREETDQYILDNIGKFKNINIFIKRGDFKYEQEGRIHSYEESLEADKEIKRLIEKHFANEWLSYESSAHAAKRIVDVIVMTEEL